MTLYRLVNGIGSYWVIANDSNQAEIKLSEILNKGEGYGFSRQRKVTEIHVIAEQITDSLTGNFLII